MAPGESVESRITGDVKFYVADHNRVTGKVGRPLVRQVNGKGVYDAIYREKNPNPPREDKKARE
jgi:hypothetical protein